MKTPTILAKIKFMVDKNFLNKQLSSTRAGDFSPVGRKSIMAGNGADKPNFIEKMLKPIVGQFKGMALTVGKVFGAITLVAALLETLKPIVGLVQNFIKLIGEFLRPISDVLVGLFTNILVMVRPVVQMFRVLMAPFRQLAMRGMSAANRLISQGMFTGGAEGAAMVSAGFQGALSSASLLMSGFMDLIFSPLKKIDFLGIGDALTDAFADWQSNAIGGVFKVIEKSRFLFDEVDDFTKLSVDEIKSSFDMIDAYIDAIKTQIGGFAIGNWMKDLDTVQTGLNTVFDPLVTLFSAENNPAKAIQGMVDKMTALKDTMPTVADAITNTITATMNRLQEEISKLTGSDAEGVFKNSLIGLEKELGKVKGTNIFTKFGDIMTASPDDLNKIIFKGANAKEMFGWTTKLEESTRLINEHMAKYPNLDETRKIGLLKEQGLMDKYYKPGTIPGALENGLMCMDDLMKKSFEPEKGKINVTFNSGLESLRKSTGNFKDALSIIANEINKIAELAANSARKAASAARNAESSSRSIRLARS